MYRKRWFFNIYKLGMSSIWSCRMSNICFDIFQLHLMKTNNNKHVILNIRHEQPNRWHAEGINCHTKLWIVRLIRLINVHVLKEDLEYVLNEESLKRNDRLLQTNFMSRLIMQGRSLFRGPWIMLWAFQIHSFYAKSK